MKRRYALYIWNPKQDKLNIRQGHTMGKHREVSLSSWTYWVSLLNESRSQKSACLHCHCSHCCQQLYRNRQTPVTSVTSPARLPWLSPDLTQQCPKSSSVDLFSHFSKSPAFQVTISEFKSTDQGFHFMNQDTPTASSMVHRDVDIEKTFKILF